MRDLILRLFRTLWLWSCPRASLAANIVPYRIACARTARGMLQEVISRKESSSAFAQDMRRRLRVGVIGPGPFAEVCHIPGLQSHPQADVVALCGRRHAHTLAMAERWKVPEVCTDYLELCAREDIDAVTVATPNVLHARQAIAALAAGKHVFCEKPLAMNIGEALDMVNAAVASGKVHQVAFTYRYLLGVHELRRRLAQGDIGELHFIRVQYDTWDGIHYDPAVSLCTRMRDEGGGMLNDVGSHQFDLVNFILGPIESVTGCTKIVRRVYIDALTKGLAAVQTDDIAAAWFVCANGVEGQLFASRVSPLSSERSYVEVIGREGALRASLSRGAVDTLSVSRPAHAAWESLPLPAQASEGEPHCLGNMMRSFVDACLRGNLDGKRDASFHDGLAAQRAIDAVRTASCRQNRIPLGNELLYR
jgi:predicted dehydrogenase